jgi:carbamate kinase
VDADVAVAALISHVVVMSEDPAFRSPAKPIGPFFTRAQADELAAERGWSVGDDSGRGFRRLVPSPHPVDILEAAAIRLLVASGTIVIAGGGGGVPVAPGSAGLTGVEAVIDKDYVAALLATSLEAQALVFVTDVARLMLDFGLPTERALAEIDVAAAERHQRDRQFPAGSMGPKVHAATQFLRSGGELAVISTAEFVARTLEPGDDATFNAISAGFGTRIVATRRAARIAT